ncbi:hypothetical protein [Microlunatus endophyticus]
MTATSAAAALAVDRARVATFSVFGFNGLLFASWSARLPAVAGIFHLSPGGLGLLLLMTGLGSVVGLPWRAVWRAGSAPQQPSGWPVHCSARRCSWWPSA